MDWEDILRLLNVGEASALEACFLSYTGMMPRDYGAWCRRRREI
jgi:hypothetical protein